MSADAGIVIVGAGPTGLTLAALLHAYGVPCRVLDAAPARTIRSQAIGVSARSLEVLDGLGAAEPLVAAGLPIATANFYSSGRLVARVTSSRATSTRYPYLLSAPQSATEEALEASLVRLGGSVERPVALVDAAPDGPHTALQVRDLGTGRTSTVHAAWVIGADGAHSTLRQTVGIQGRGPGADRVYANVDCMLRGAPPRDAGHYYFSRHGLMVIAPLPGGRFRLTASLPAGGVGEAVDAAAMERLLHQRADARIAVDEVSDSGWGVARVVIRTRIADSFRSGGCVLAGDAAHVYGPTGAQGMNGGIQDAHALAWRLALVARGQAGPSLLDEYATERRAVARATLRHVEMQTSLATLRPAPARLGRDLLLGAASRLGLLDRWLGPRITQLDIAYPPPGAEGDAPLGAVGRRLPDLTLFEGGTPVHLHALFAPAGSGPRPIVLATGLDRTDDITLRAARDHGRAAWGLDVLPVTASGPTGLVDAQGTLDRALGHPGPTVWLVRPDHHVYASAPMATPALLDHHVSTLMATASAGAPSAPVDAHPNTNPRISSVRRSGRSSGINV